MQVKDAASGLQQAKVLVCHQTDPKALFDAQQLVIKILDTLPVLNLDGTHMLEGWSRIMGSAAVLLEQITPKMENLKSVADDAMHLLLESDAGAASGASKPGKPGKASTQETGPMSPKKKKKKKAKKNAKKQSQAAAQPQPSPSNTAVDDEQRVERLKAEMLLARSEENARAQEWADQRALAEEDQEQAPVPTAPLPGPMAVAVAPSLCECPVCLEDYLSPPSDHMPLSLPCGHTQCRLCVENMEAAALGAHTGGGPLIVQCPRCRKVLELPPGGTDALPCNYDLVEVMEALARVSASAARENSPPYDLAGKIARLELVWPPATCAAAGGGNGYIARVQALEVAVMGASCVGALPVRVAALEQHSGL
jgi:hypothetical protein